MKKACITVDNVWAYPEDERDIIRDTLTFKQQGYFHSPAYKKGFWDGNVCLLSKVVPATAKRPEQPSRFPAGLLAYVSAALEGYGIEVVPQWADVDTTYDEPVGFEPLQQCELDEVQERAVTAALSFKRGLIKYPTGSGKTRIMGEIIRRADKQSLVLCDKQDLHVQLIRELDPIIGQHVGAIGGGQGMNPRACTVATVQAIARALSGANIDRKAEMLAYLRSVKTVIIDEAHHLTGDTYAQVLMRCINANIRIGVSATPFKQGGHAEDLKVIGWAGPVIAALSNTEAIQTGRIVPADVFIVSGLGWVEPKEDKKFTNWGQQVDHGLIENTRRNRAIAFLAERIDKQVIILVDRTEHGTILAEMTGAPFIYGGTKSAVRKATWDGFKAGEIATVIVSKLGNEGLDLPNIDVVILAGAGQAPHRTIQQIGRGMRSSSGKERLSVFDFADTGKYLDKHYKTRRKTYENDPAYTVADVTWEEVKTWL